MNNSFLGVLGVGEVEDENSIWPDSSLKDLFQRNLSQYVGVGCGWGGRCK